MGNICWRNHLCCNSRGLKCGLHYKNVVKHLLKDLLAQLTVFSFTADMFALSYMIVCVVCILSVTVTDLISPLQHRNTFMVFQYRNMDE